MISSFERSATKSWTIFIFGSGNIMFIYAVKPKDSRDTLVRSCSSSKYLPFVLGPLNQSNCWCKDTTFPIMTRLGDKKCLCPHFSSNSYNEPTYVFWKGVVACSITANNLAGSIACCTRLLMTSGNVSEDI